MQQRKQLYDKAKHYQTEEAWAKHRKLKNEIIKEINQAHESYQNNLFDSQTAWFPPQEILEIYQDIA